MNAPQIPAVCNLCQSPEPTHETRRSFLWKLAGGLAVSAGMLCTRRVLGQPATSAPLPTPNGRASWARLITSSPFWALHAEQDAAVANFIRREAHLNLDATSYSVDPANLDALAAFPFIFTNALTAVVDSQQLDNLKEYLQRGGFFFVEGCLDHRVTRSFNSFMGGHLALFEKLAPGCVVRKFAPNHPIFRAYFPVEERKLSLIEPTDDDLRWKGAPQALYGIFQKSRMISLISLQHLQCEWFTKPEKVPFCMQQIANIYIYAMTR